MAASSCQTLSFLAAARQGVEVATPAATVHVRDSMRTEGPVLTVPPAVWGRFLEAATVIRGRG